MLAINGCATEKSAITLIATPWGTTSINPVRRISLIFIAAHPKLSLHLSGIARKCLLPRLTQSKKVARGDTVHFQLFAPSDKQLWVVTRIAVLSFSIGSASTSQIAFLLVAARKATQPDGASVTQADSGGGAAFTSSNLVSTLSFWADALMSLEAGRLPITGRLVPYSRALPRGASRSRRSVCASTFRPSPGPITVWREEEAGADGRAPRSCVPAGPLASVGIGTASSRVRVPCSRLLVHCDKRVKGRPSEASGLEPRGRQSSQSTPCALCALSCPRRFLSCRRSSETLGIDCLADDTRLDEKC
jgi:hypothetical protein